MTLKSSHLKCGKLTSNHTHDERMWNSRFDVQGLFIQCFKFFVILLNRIHLNFQSINLQQLCALFQIIFAIIRLEKTNDSLKIWQCFGWLSKMLLDKIDAIVWEFSAICWNHFDQSTISQVWCLFWTTADHFWHLSRPPTLFHRNFVAVPSIKRKNRIDNWKC